MNSVVLGASADKKQGTLRNKFNSCELCIHYIISLNLKIHPQVESEIKPRFALEKGQDMSSMLFTIPWSGGFF